MSDALIKPLTMILEYLLYPRNHVYYLHPFHHVYQYHNQVLLLSLQRLTCKPYRLLTEPQTFFLFRGYATARLNPLQHSLRHYENVIGGRAFLIQYVHNWHILNYQLWHTLPCHYLLSASEHTLFLQMPLLLCRIEYVRQPDVYHRQ